MWKMNKKLFLILSIVFFVIAFAFRASETLSHNFLFLVDQGRDMMEVKGILYDHHLTLIGPYTSLQGVFQGPLWYYLLVIPTFLAHGDPWGAVILMLVISMSTILISTFFMNKLFGKTAALFTLFLFTFSPEAIAAATYSWNPHPMWLLIILYIFTLFFVVEKKVKYHLFLWPIIFLMFHFETALAVFFFVGTLIFLFIFHRAVYKTKFFLLGFILGASLFLPQILFDIRHEFLMTKSVMRLFEGSTQGLTVTGEDYSYLALVKNHIDLFYYNFRTTFPRDGYLQYLPQVILAYLVFSLITLFRKKKKDKDSSHTFIHMITSMVVIMFLLSLLYPFPIRYWFLTGFQGFFLLLLGLLFSRAWEKPIGKVFLIFVGVLFFFYGSIRLYNLYAFPDYGGIAKFQGKLDAVKTLYQDAGEKQFNVLIFTPPVYTDVYDYLLWWYGEDRFGFVPRYEKGDTFFLLIEPDPEKPWSYKGWLETVVKTGNIEYTKQLRSGLIVQKRTLNENKK